MSPDGTPTVRLQQLLHDGSATGRADFELSPRGPKMLMCHFCARGMEVLHVGFPLFKEGWTSLPKPMIIVTFTVCAINIPHTEYGTQSLAIHQKTCRRKLSKSLPNLPEGQDEALQQVLAGTLSTREFNAAAFEKWLHIGRVSCPHCERRFYPDRLAVHLRSCNPNGYFAKQVWNGWHAACACTASCVLYNAVVCVQLVPMCGAPHNTSGKKNAKSHRQHVSPYSHIYLHTPYSHTMPTHHPHIHTDKAAQSAFEHGEQHEQHRALPAALSTRDLCQQPYCTCARVHKALAAAAAA